MLPKSVETARGLYLKAIADKACEVPQGLNDWPMLTKDDYVLVGALVVLFSYIDMNLRRIVEVADRVEMLQEPWKGKTGKLGAAEVSAAAQSLALFDSKDRAVLVLVEEHRRFRNLVAHFAIRRFPNDDALLFIAKSARDYKRVFNTAPQPGVLLTAVADCEHMRAAIREIEEIQNRLGQLAPKLENELIPLLEN
jgi:hypothetical protein